MAKDCECRGCQNEADGYCRFCGKDFCEDWWGKEAHGCWKSMGDGHTEDNHTNE